jgi:hypothetical protein
MNMAKNNINNNFDDENEKNNIHKFDEDDLSITNNNNNENLPEDDDLEEDEETYISPIEFDLNIEEEEEDSFEEDVVEIVDFDITPQSVTVDDNNKIIVIDKKPKGKRGRPRKFIAEKAVITTRGKRGRPRKLIDEKVIVKPKGKRGRPRKLIDEKVIVKPKGKRGRPRKLIDEKVIVKPKGKRGRPRKLIDEKVITIKRKRGRPMSSATEEEKRRFLKSAIFKKRKISLKSEPLAIRKNSKKQYDEFNPKNDKIMKNKRGRPRKSEPKNSDLVSSMPKRGRGRPKKEPSGEIKPKGKRGRPRKVEEVTLSKKHASPKLKTKKRGRGRPRKEDVLYKKNASPMLKTKKRGRGRPRKEESMSKTSAAPHFNTQAAKYQVERGLKAPDYIINYKAQTKYPFGDMMVGDSFKLDGEKSRERLYSATSRYERRPENKGKTFRVSTNRDKRGNIVETRVWRVS